MFDISWSELMLIAVVALIVIGPKELPGLLRTVGRVVGKLRRSADEFRRQFNDTVRDAGGEDLQRELNQLRYNNPLNQLRHTIEDAAREVTAPLGTPLSPTVPPASTGDTTPPAVETGGVPPAPAAEPATPAPQDTLSNVAAPEAGANGQTRPAN